MKEETGIIFTLTTTSSDFMNWFCRLLITLNTIETEDQLTVWYITFNQVEQDGGRKKWTVDLLDRDIIEGKQWIDWQQNDVPIALEDINLFQKMPAGPQLKANLSCDSTFMTRDAPRLAVAQCPGSLLVNQLSCRWITQEGMEWKRRFVSIGHCYNNSN